MCSGDYLYLRKCTHGRYEQTYRDAIRTESTMEASLLSSLTVYNFVISIYNKNIYVNLCKFKKDIAIKSVKKSALENEHLVFHFY